jgi:integrase/recombinase XerD
MNLIHNYSGPLGTLIQKALAAHLDGSAGTNRQPVILSQIGALNDFEAVQAWLARLDKESATAISYRKEAERLLLWTLIERHKPLSSLTHEDLMAYRQFVADPQPPERWIMAGSKRARGHPEWRPFCGPLSPSSVRQSQVILNGLFAWLVNAGYLTGNPLSLSRQRARKSAPRITRLLSNDQWEVVKQSIHAMPQSTPREREHYHRARWLVTLFYIGGLRISEVAENSMGSFFVQRDKDGPERWWLEIQGKGQRIRLVPATDDLMTELMRYRRSLSLPALPIAGETVPLVLPIGGRQKQLTRAAVHIMMKNIFEVGARRLESIGEAGLRDAHILRTASAHWLRHTAATHMMDSDVDLRHVRDNLGHVSISTTSLYVHSEDDARHQSTNTHHRIQW